MRLHRFTHCGSFAFPNEITIDFDALDPIVAITGPNGAGKTSALDFIASAWIGECAYRPGSMSKNFAAPGHIDLTWSLTGRRYRSVLKVDPASERTEGTLYAEDGTVIAGPLIRDYRREIVKLVGPPEFFLASAYATQSGVGALLTASRAERKALLGELLGLQRYVMWEAYAKGKVRVAETQLAGLRARVAELGKQAEQIPPLTFRLANLLFDRDVAEGNVSIADLKLYEAAAVLEVVRAALVALDPAMAELSQVQQEMSALTAQHLEAAGRRTKNAEVLRRETEITFAVARMTALRTELVDLEEKLDLVRTQQQEVVVRRQAIAERRTVALGDVATAERDRTRLHRQASLLVTVPCEGKGPYAGCALLKDAKAAHESLPAIEAAVTAAKDFLVHLPEPAPVIDAIAPLIAQKRMLESERSLLATLAELAGPLDAARARVEELDGQLAELGARQAAATVRRDACAVRLAERPACQRGVNTAEGAVANATRNRGLAQIALSQVEREVGQVEGQLAAVRAAGEACAAAQAELGPVEQDLGEWSLLQRALGPSGIPALLVDQACPELSRLTTDQLTTCFGEQVFSVSLTTQRESAAGDKLLETLDVIVRRHGEPIDAALLSGGEKVLVSEALSLALAIYAAGRSGRKVETLLRDEVGAALDSERAPAYTAMLRRAAQLGGFKHVLFVTHNERAAELADARLEIADGRVTVS